MAIQELAKVKNEMKLAHEHIKRVAEFFEKQPIIQQYSLQVMLDFIMTKAQQLRDKLHDLETHALSTCNSSFDLDVKLRKALEAERMELRRFY